jgi:hypothetical protein
MGFTGALHLHLGDRPAPGVEQVLRFSRDCGWGDAIGFGGTRLPARSWTPLASLRARYAPLAAAAPPGLPVIYHQLEGLDLFATEDAGRHRLFWIREPFVRWGEMLGWAARYADAFLFDQPEWEAEALERIPWLPARRRRVLPASTLADPAGAEAAREVLGDLLALPIVRKAGSPGGRLMPYGFYRRQLAGLV